MVWSTLTGLLISECDTSRLLDFGTLPEVVRKFSPLRHTRRGVIRGWLAEDSSPGVERAVDAVSNNVLKLFLPQLIILKCDVKLAASRRYIGRARLFLLHLLSNLSRCVLTNFSIYICVMSISKHTIYFWITFVISSLSARSISISKCTVWSIFPATLASYEI